MAGTKTFNLLWALFACLFYILQNPICFLLLHCIMHKNLRIAFYPLGKKADKKIYEK